MNGYLVLLIIAFITLLIGVGLFYLGRFFFNSKIQEDSNNPNSIKVTRGVLFQAFLIVGFLLTLSYFEYTGHRWAAILMSLIYLGLSIMLYFLNRNVKK